MAWACGAAEIAVSDPGGDQAAETFHINESEPVNSAALSPEGSLLALGLRDGVIRLWDMSTGQPLRALRGHTLPVCALAFSPDGARLVSGGGWDHTNRIWDTATGQELLTLTGPQNWALAAAFSPDGGMLATGTWGSQVRVFNVPRPPAFLAAPSASP